jgi:microcin C transport system permease protein
MLLVIAGFPSAFISLFFTGSLLIETMFTIDGLGYLGFTSVLQRDYPVMFGTLFLFSLIGLISLLLGDLTMMMVDPRLDFKGRS